MKRTPFESPVAKEAERQMRTLCLVDGRSLRARVTKVEENGIQVTSPEMSGFINATELCTVDRVFYRFGSRNEDAWVARMDAKDAERKLARLTPA